MIKCFVYIQSINNKSNNIDKNNLIMQKEKQKKLFNNPDENIDKTKFFIIHILII